MEKAKFETKTIEHLGLVAGMCDELGIGELIDEMVPQDLGQRYVSVGQAVKAMILNGLGFANRRLYLTPRFFKNKPTERLLGRGVSWEMLNDDALGRALDELHTFGVTELFTLIAQRACKRLGLRSEVAHLDSTSFHVDGAYEVSRDEQGEEGVVRLVQGYSRDNRPDLNQVVLELIAENQASLPLVMVPLSGNASDKTSFAAAIDAHASQLTAAGVEVIAMDSAGFTPATIEALQASGVTWVMSVPATVKAAAELLADSSVEGFKALTAGYEACVLSSEYTGVKQRWLLIRSEAARERAAVTAQRQLLKLGERERKRFDTLCREAFSCKADALQALDRYRESCQVLEIHEPEVNEVRHYQKAGRPGKDSAPEHLSYRLSGALATSLSVFAERVERGSRFILATNDTDSEHLSDAGVLGAYKGQVHAERGFRFLKDPMFLANTLYLKKAERIMALLMVMTLCLLVYAALEHRIRKALNESGTSVPDQKGKATKAPTAKWVFELFLDVHLLLITQGTLQVLSMNLEDEVKTLLYLLGPHYTTAYS